MVKDKSTKQSEQKVNVDYFILMKWFWDTAPYIDGFKSSTGFLFLAIVDSLNRNFWKSVSIPFDFILNKCRINKRTYLKDREWLVGNNFLSIQPGKNPYQMATFNLGLAVQKCTTQCTTIDTTTAPQSAPQDAPRSAPILKQETETTNNKQIQTIFSEKFLNEYWNGWKKYKKECLKFSYKSLETEQFAINHLEDISNKDEDTARKIIEQAIAGAWKGLHSLGGTKTNNQNNHVNGKNNSANSKSGFQNVGKVFEFDPI